MHFLSLYRLLFFIVILTWLIISLDILPPPTLSAKQDSKVYLPLITHTWNSPFGIEVNRPWMIKQSVFAQANDLGAKWVRLNAVSWRSVQPTQDRNYDWEALLEFEADLVSAQIANLTPIIVVDDYPHWATKTYYDANNQPYQTSCGALREEHFDDFAAFMYALVSRYKNPPYNVQYWELGNEVDVDPSRLPVDNVFGCWGDIDDPYHGGEHYGKMLRVVTPAIKQADPNAQVLNGGLALGHGAGEPGSPEKFFEGILLAGAGDSFDIVAYHVYPEYGGVHVDRDLQAGPWTDAGGMTIGKAKFLRSTMARYGVDKPLFLNETGLMHSSGEPGPDYFQAQADHIVRLVARAMSVDIQAVCWYTLNGPGWRYTALLDGEQNPRPSYFAYQHLIKQVSMTRTVTAISDYGTGVEAYRFAKSNGLVDLLWATEGGQQTIRVPRSQVIAIYDRDGATIAPTIVGDQVRLEVGVSPIYIKRAP